MDPINIAPMIPFMLAYIPYMDPMGYRKIPYRHWLITGGQCGPTRRS